MKARFNKELVVFDLDGTLIDSSGDIAWAANRTLEETGRKPRDLLAIKAAIGSGVRYLLEQLMPGAGPDVIEEARKRFLFFYADHLTVETRFYPGVLKTLGHLRGLGKLMALVTNKPIELTQRIIEEMGLKPFFLVVLGGDSLANRKPHPEPIEQVMAELGVAASKTLYVGDTALDYEAATGAGVDMVGVSYGFRPRSEIEQAGCEVIIDSLGELREIVV